MEPAISQPLQRWAATQVRRIGHCVPPLVRQRPRKLLLVHLDGVPRALLEESVASGAMPFLSRLVRSGAYHLDGAFWGSPSSTPFFQAGLLYGQRHPNLPAYSWFDRELGRRVQMNTPRDALAIEERLAQRGGNSLLAGGGHTYFSLFRADAENRLCMSTLANMKMVARSLRQETRGVMSARRQGVWSVLRSLVHETWCATQDVVRWARALHDWRHEREFLLSRVLLQRVGWSFAHSKAMVDMVQGIPAVYLVYGNYDEVAHRRGPRSPEALAELLRVDADLAELYAVARVVEHPYDVVFVTDHGHVDAQPIEQRQGQRLESLLFQGSVPRLPDGIETALLDGRARGSREHALLDPVVVEAGNFSHVYLSRGREPLEALELVSSHRDVLARAVAHRDIGIVVLRLRTDAVALVQGGVYRAGQIDSAPLSTEFSKRAVADFLRELPHMQTAGDLVLFGEATPVGGTVGFAWEFGSHGGLTRTETESVVCWPSDSPLKLGGLTHCAQLHDKLSEVYREEGR